MQITTREEKINTIDRLRKTVSENLLFKLIIAIITHLHTNPYNYFYKIVWQKYNLYNYQLKRFNSLYNVNKQSYDKLNRIWLLNWIKHTCLGSPRQGSSRSVERILLDYFRSCLNTIPKYPFSLKLKLMYLECIIYFAILTFSKVYYSIFYFVCELTRTFNNFTPCKWIRQINNKINANNN